MTTPRPWTKERGTNAFYAVGPGSCRYALKSLGDSLGAEADIEFAIRAVNAHEALVAAAKRSLSYLASYPGGAAMACYDQAREALRLAGEP